MTITATFIKPIPASSWTAACFTISPDADPSEWAALPKSITRRFHPNYRFTIDLRSTEKNPINEAGIKKIRRILDTLDVDDDPAKFANSATREEFREIHAI